MKSKKSLTKYFERAYLGVLYTIINFADRRLENKMRAILKKYPRGGFGKFSIPDNAFMALVAVRTDWEFHGPKFLEPSDEEVMAWYMANHYEKVNGGIKDIAVSEVTSWAKHHGILLAPADSLTPFWEKFFDSLYRDIGYLEWYNRGIFRIHTIDRYRKNGIDADLASALES